MKGDSVLNNSVKDITRYGERVSTLEIEVNITQYVYLYDNNRYLITMKNGDVVSLYIIK